MSNVKKISNFYIVLLIVLGLVFCFFNSVRNFSDGVLVKAAGLMTTVTVSLPSYLTQNDFQFFSPNASTTPTDCWPPGSTYCLAKNNNLTLAFFPIHQGDIIRLRTSFTASTNLGSNSFRVKLQFKPKGAGCSANETWYNLGEAGSSVAWRGFDIPSLDNNVPIEGDPCITGSTGVGYYNESGVSDWNSTAVSSGAVLEFDWVIQNNSASYGTTYCFRAVQVNSADEAVNLYSYQRYIEIETLPQYVVTESSTTDYTVGGSFHLTNPNNTQFFIEPPANYYNESLNFNIYSFNKSDIMASISAPTGRTALGSYIYQAESGADNFFYEDFNQNIALKLSYTDAEVSGYDENTLEMRRWTGSEWLSLTSTVDTVNNLITAQTPAFSYFGIFGEEEGEEGPSCGDGSCNGSETCSSCSTDCGSCSSGGGGGGGGGSYVVPTQVVLQGIAYPSADITILKDGQVATFITADSQADFKVTLTILTAGTYTFSLWAEDKEGRRSITFSFTATVTQGMTTTIGGIFLPPTIELDKTGVKKGEIINILGQTAPQSALTIRVESSQPIIATTTADKLGDWGYPFNTSPLADGIHFAKVKVNLNGLLSSYSNVLAFYVGKEVAPGKVKTADIRGDGRVNLIDFSILLYNWGTPKNTAADLNGDGLVNLVDFSIMMYQWTG